jgi:RHS repeat-associated protein
VQPLRRSTIYGDVYTLDPVGNRTAKQDDLAGVTSNYTYDQIYELTQVMQGANTTESYSYDSVGNRLTSLSVPSYTVNSSNELTGASNASFTYDQNGNTTAKTNSSGTTNYTWDYENRMTSATLPNNGGTTTFKYDPFGRRIEKIAPSGTSIFAYDGDGNDLVETVSGTGGELTRYTQTQHLDEPLAVEQNGTIDYYEQDGLGSVTSLTNPAGQLAETYTYDSFGNTTHSSGSLANPLEYTGREFDSETGLYYDRARYYDPSLGRFTSEDPLGKDSGDLNFYRYVQNSPIDESDPLGCGRTYDCGAGCGFRVDTNDPKGPHVNWWCNGVQGCLRLPDLSPCEVGKSYVPPNRILKCIRKKLRLPEPAPQPAPAPCTKPLGAPIPYIPIIEDIFEWLAAGAAA